MQGPGQKSHNERLSSLSFLRLSNLDNDAILILDTFLVVQSYYSGIWLIRLPSDLKSFMSVKFFKMLSFGFRLIKKKIV